MAAAFRSVFSTADGLLVIASTAVPKASETAAQGKAGSFQPTVVQSSGCALIVLVSQAGQALAPRKLR